MIKVFLKISSNFIEITLRHGCSPVKTCSFIKKETLAQVFSYEFCEIFKNTFFAEHLWTTASERYENTRYVRWHAYWD